MSALYRRVAVAAVACMALAGCTIGADTLPSADPPSTTQPEPAPSATPHDPAPSASESVPPGEDEVRAAVQDFIDAAQDATSYQFTRRVETTTLENGTVTTTADGLVDLETAQREITMSIEFSDQTYEAEVLAAAGLEAVTQLNLRLIVDGSEIYLTFPNHAAWRGSWVRLDAADIDALLAGLGVDLDPVDAAGPLDQESGGWLDAIALVVESPTGFEDDWLTIGMNPEVAIAVAPRRLIRAFADSGLRRFNTGTGGYAWAGTETLSTAVFLSPLLAEAVARKPELVSLAIEEVVIDTTIWNLDTLLAVLPPAAANVVATPPSTFD